VITDQEPNLMISVDAVELALACFQDPLAHQDQLEASAPLPSGMDRLLALATGSPWLLEEAALDARVTPDELRQAVQNLIPRLCFADNASYYRTLGLDPEASSQQIEDHYRALLLLYHPDRAATRDGFERFTARLNQAYSALSKPQSRALYDDVLQESGSAASTVEWQPEESIAEGYGHRLQTAIRSWAQLWFGRRTEMLWVLPGLVVMVGLAYQGQRSSVPDTVAGVVPHINQPTLELTAGRLAGDRPSELPGTNDLPRTVPDPVAVTQPTEQLAKVSDEPPDASRVAPVAEPSMEDTRMSEAPDTRIAAQPTVSGSESSVVVPATLATALPAVTPTPAPTVASVPAPQPRVAALTKEKVAEPVAQPVASVGKPVVADPVLSQKATTTDLVVPQMVDPRLTRDLEDTLPEQKLAAQPAPAGGRPGDTGPAPSQKATASPGATGSSAPQMAKPRLARSLEETKPDQKLAAQPAPAGGRPADAGPSTSQKATASPGATDIAAPQLANPRLARSLEETEPDQKLAAQPAPAGGRPADAAPAPSQKATASAGVTDIAVLKMASPRLAHSLEENPAPGGVPVQQTRKSRPSEAGASLPEQGKRPERSVSRTVLASSAPTATSRPTVNQTPPRQPRVASSTLTTGDIEGLFANYGGAIRSGDVNQVMALFAPEACGPDNRDREVIRQNYADLFGNNTIRRLQLSNPHWSLRGDKSTAVACSVLWLRNRDTGAMRQAIGPIRLDVEKRDGRVLISATDKNWLTPPKPLSELTSEEIEEQVERYAGAFRSGDLNRVMGLIKPMDCCNGEADRQALRQPYAELFGAYKIRRLQLSDLRWDICGDSAKVVTQYEVWLMKRGNGQPSQRTGTIRLDLQRRDGRVLIVNVEHTWQAS
jgi:ketosteroid isomerase-like protein